MFLKAMLTNYFRQLTYNPHQLPLMQQIGNSTQEVSSLIALTIWITVSWLLVTIAAKTGLLKTHGELHGEKMDISHLLLEILAVALTLHHILLSESNAETNK